MGKSPGKWIKTMLFGKKATRSVSTEGRNALKAGNGKGYTAAIGPTTSMENSPVISEPVLSMYDNGFNKELKKGSSSSSGADASVITCTSPGARNQGVVGHAGLNDGEKFRKEQAAIKAQAVFRGFLARRAFRTLKGIIRLQALVRGHLVRRQAVVTLHSTLGIIKLQTLARSKKVPKFLDSKKSKPFSNAFVCKLLYSSLVVIPLQIQYDQGEPNSLFNWMNRWTFSQFWKPVSQQKKSLDSNFHPKRGSYAMETESRRSKRNVHRNSANVDAEPEKSKRNMRKVIASADSLHDDPQSELEKVKRNLRKVTSSYLETNRMVIQTDNKEQSIGDTSDSMKKDIVLLPDPIPDIEVASKSIIVEEPVDLVYPVVDNPPADSTLLPSIDKEENISVMDEALNVKKEQTCKEPQKAGKRRASFSTKPEYAENGVQNAPTLPSYMQATESAKAKLRGQTSPILGSDSAEKNGVARRHSLPSSTNGKVISHSPRTQRILQASVKGGIRSDRSLLPSRDANEKLIQVEWKR